MTVCKLVGGLGLSCGMLLFGLAQTGCSSSHSKFSDLPNSATKPGETAASKATPPSMTSGAVPVAIATASANSSALSPTASSSGQRRIIDMIQPGDMLKITFADLPPPMAQQPTEERVK